MVVVNKPGAAGMVGGLEGVKADPDGYTLSVGTTGQTCSIEWENANNRKPAWTRHDQATIGSFVLSPALVVVPYDSPWKTLADMIKDCKAKPGYYAFSSGGLYGGSHLPAEILMADTGIKCRHVPYKGGGPALAAVVGKHVDFATQFPPTSIPLMRGNKLRILAVLGPKRLKSIPDVPAAPELGLGPFQMLNWIGILITKETPADIVKKLRDNAAVVAKDKTFINAIESAGDEVIFMNGEQLAKYWDEESVKIVEILKRLVAAEVRK
jgi:tripartite-type tricarboxylate transporter receptor subunit TctC